MKHYRVKTTVFHNGKEYPAGSLVPLDNPVDIKALLNVDAIEADPEATTDEDGEAGAVNSPQEQLPPVEEDAPGYGQKPGGGKRGGK